MEVPIDIKEALPVKVFRPDPLRRSLLAALIVALYAASAASAASAAVASAQRLAKAQSDALDEQFRNPRPGSSSGAPPRGQSGSSNPAASREVFGSHCDEEEVALGLDVRRLYRGPTAEEWLGADGERVWIDPTNQISSSI